jgi:hypothetical protein
MTPRDSDPLLDRLRDLRRNLLDDVTATRTLARAEAALAAPRSPARASVKRSWVPAALAVWGALYLWSAVSELGRLFPASDQRAADSATGRVESRHARSVPSGLPGGGRMREQGVDRERRRLGDATGPLRPARADRLRQRPQV